MRVRRSPFTLAALLTAAMLLAGCNADEPKPKFEAEPSPSTSQATTPSPSATAERETAEEFIRRWVAEANSMQADGQTEEFLAMSPRCSTCDKLATRVEAMYAKGGYIKTDGWTVRSISLMGEGDDSAEYKLKVISAPTEYREYAGSAIKTYEGGTRTISMVVSREGDRWRLDDYLDMGA